jgi:hypothetical protein
MLGDVEHQVAAHDAYAVVVETAEFHGQPLIVSFGSTSSPTS